MDLPDAQKGMAILAEHIQRINAAIRQTRIRPGIGYFLRETAGGTSLVIPQGTLGGGGQRACGFEVTDASELDAGVLKLKIEVQQDPIAGTANDTYPDGRYPSGMSGADNAPPFKIEIEQSEGVEYVYVNVQVDQLNAILPASTAITVSSETVFSLGNSTYQKHLVAIVEKSLDDEDKPYISQITNVCPIVYQRPAPTCPFLVEDDSRDGECRVTVRSGLVANALPDDMTLSDTFTLTLANTSDFWVIYCGMVVADGVIQTGAGDITIFASDQYQESTDTYVYFKLAELNVSLRENGDRYVSYVLNTCAVPFVAGGGAAGTCYFRVTDASEGAVLKVEVGQWQIAGRWPDGMGLDFPPYILELSGSSYIYAKVTYNTTTLQILPDANAITIFQTDTVQQNTASDVFILIATVVVSGTPPAIASITNACTVPAPNPCTLAWGE